MILIGNGPLPFASPAPVGAGANASGVALRSATSQNGTAPEATIPAAAPNKTGQSQASAVIQTQGNTIRAVLAPSRTEATVTNPEDLYRTPGATAIAASSVSTTSSGATRSETLQSLEKRPDPPPPLSAYASIPSEVTAEIQRLRVENAELKMELAEKDRQIEQAKAEAAAEPTQPAETSAPEAAAQQGSSANDSAPMPQSAPGATAPAEPAAAERATPIAEPAPELRE